MQCRLRLFCLALAVWALPASAQEIALSTGQSIYLPVYSHIYHGDLRSDGKPSQTLVSTHVSIRNTSTTAPIRLTSANYFNTDGKLVRNYLSTAVTVPPMGTHELFVPLSDTAGGSGANFVIVWTADAPVNPPIVEGLHADIREARTLMLHTSGVVIKAR
jgi:hypothetical protein